MDNVLLDAKDSCCNIKIANLIYDPEARMLSNGSELIELEPKTIELLELFLTHSGEPISNEKIIMAIWNRSYISKNVVTNRISSLRNVLKPYLVDVEPNKLIITYPKKGYFIPRHLISLSAVDNMITGSNNDPDLSLGSEVSKDEVSINSFVKNNRLLIFLSFIFILVYMLIIFGGDVKDSNENGDRNLFIPQVHLLLNNIRCPEDDVKPYMVRIKSMILHSQAMYPYTDLSNLHSPGYFLQKIDSSCYWPGGMNNKLSDYDLSFNLWMENKNIYIESVLYRSPTNKVAWRNIYHSDPESLHIPIQAMANDLAKYFQLPKPTLRAEQLMMNNIPLNFQVDNVNWGEVNVSDLSNNEMYFLSRELMFSDVEAEILEGWIAKVKKSNPIPDPELYIWLSLLTYKSGQIERGLEMLNREYIAEFVDNAFVYLLKSNLSYRVGDIEHYRSNYLRAMSALTVVVDSNKILEHFKSNSVSKSCYLLWESIPLPNESLANNKVAFDNIKEFCHHIDQFI
ncbi:winged helix-turn-helix domain-containing protein [Vibrio metschnikovii]|uniref:winged helix-turn-helix domain-containing protein n=1 Tax=Vibrio metschnikovii TaxID=28172 RepID=UPI00164A79E6|nr:winged helix-turn-helix domain-containing protein [Vibrio metschnikovii]MBC5830889.1 winged helix-turn-helix domain-containing protein [Vibrio metschnikovii]